MRGFAILMMIVGFVMLLAGGAMFVGSIFTLTSAAKSAMESRVVGSVDLSEDQEAVSSLITVDTKQSCQIVVETDLSGKDVVKSTSSESWELDYSLPFECTVLGEEGKVLHQESRTLSRSGFRTWTNRDVNEDGGEERTRHFLGVFQVPPPGVVIVKAKLGKDTRHETTIREAKVDLLDNVSGSSTQAASGMAMCCGGPGLAVLGLFVMLFGLILSFAAPKRPPPGPPQFVHTYR